ncbi:MAG: hypothetical protein AAF389_13345 [Gemmatimonadota bacterium]
MEERDSLARRERATRISRELEQLDELEVEIARLRPGFKKARKAVAFVVGFALLPAAFGAPREWLQIAVWTALAILAIGYLPSWWRYRTLRKRLQRELDRLD